MQRNLMFKAGVIVVTILVCIFGIIGFPGPGSSFRTMCRRISTSGWI